MKKESVIAIFFGIIFGALVAIFLLAKNKEFQLTKTKTIAPTEKLGKIAKNVIVDQKTLEILEPKDGLISDSKTVTIKGKADKGALIVIQSPIKETILKNEKDQFSVLFPLVLGENVIKVSAHLKDTQARPQERELRIYYLDEQL